jgi:hypothetical protein
MLKQGTPEEQQWHRHDSNCVWIMEENPAFAPVSQSAPIPEPEPTLTPTPEPKPVIKKAPEKPKPASDMPTLFDF